MTQVSHRLQASALEDIAPDETQRLASEPSTSVWVNASAGTGKTRVLTNRVTRLLLEGVLPQKILCLTYTRAAAAEMATRITEQLSHWATCGENELSASLSDLQGKPPTPRQREEARRLFARVLACPGGMRIRTIHAFCQEILRRFPIEAGLPPHFMVIEETDARALQEDVQKDVLKHAAGAPDSEVNHALALLASHLGEHGFTEAMCAILGERARFKAALERTGSFEKLIGLIRKELSLAPDETEERLCRVAAEAIFTREKDLRLLAQGWSESGKLHAPRGAKLASWLAMPPTERAASFESYGRCFVKDDGEPYQKATTKALLAKYPMMEDIVTREAEHVRAVMERLEAVASFETTVALLRIGNDMISRYEERKAEQSVLDYDDLIIRTDALLRRPGIAPWVLYKLDGGLDHILVDEAQDTSRAQWSIVAALADEFFAGKGARDDNNRTLFVVGDEKQSIFSFQRADPEAFADYRRSFAAKIHAAEKDYRETPMRVSFRSAPAILKAVDAVFALDRARVGVAQDIVHHRASQSEAVGRVEVWPLQPASAKEESGEDDAWLLPLGYENERDPQAELAGKIADKIAGWLIRGEKLSGEGRSIKPGDIMILLRRRGRFADLMVRALKERRVPVTGVDRMHLISQLPVMDVLALMQFALLPEDDLNLASLLKSPLLGYSEEQLMTLAIGRKTNLWASLTDAAANSPSLEAAHSYLSRWLGAADFISPFDFLSLLLSEPCPGSARSGFHAIRARLGPDAVDPVNELLNVAQSFSHRHAPSLQSFLHWLKASDAEIKRELDRGMGEVKIMTVHAAKGLEAPIVFLPDSASLPRPQDFPKILWSDGDIPFYAARRPKSGIIRHLWDGARIKQLQEYRRLLYVALTRSARQIYIGGWETEHKPANSEESWYSLITEALKSSHSPATAEAAEPFPDIAFADIPLRKTQDKHQPEKTIATTPLPDWATRPAPLEDNPLRSVSPSHLAALAMSAAAPDRSFLRGRIIHRLLESLPDVEDTQRDAVVARYLAGSQHGLTSSEQKEIADEVLGLLRNPAYADLFASGSRAEVPIIGRIGGNEISGQVDRLCVTDDTVFVVDYKTNRPPPQTEAHIPEPYILQLEAYRAVLKDIYPGKKIRSFLLWTYGPRLMEILGS